jgi:hypothetical protein
LGFPVHIECEFFGKLGQEMAREFAMKRKHFSVDLKVASQNRAVTRCHLKSPYGTSWHLMALPDRTKFSE